MIRVLQVLEATEGGTLEHLRQLVPGLDPRRFTSAVAVGLSRGPGAAPVLDGFRAAGVRVEVGPLQRAPHLTRDAAALAWLRGLLRSGDFDLVHTHAAKAGFLARLAAHIEGVPAVYAPHGWPFLNPEFPPALRRAYASLERLAAGWCQRIIAVSPGEAQDALDWRIARPDQLAVAPNGVDVAALRALPAATRAELDLAPDALVVLTIGRRAPQKGDRYLLDAWPQVVAGHPRAVLVLVGDGPLEAEVQAQAAALGIAASVRFLGRVPQAARLLGLADIFVLPSIFEGLPYALLEAMALGRACLASNIAGVREVLRAGETGLLAPPAKPAALAAGLLRLAGDASLRARLGAAAATWVARAADARAQWALIGSVYEDVLSRRAARSAGRRTRLGPAR